MNRNIIKLLQLKIKGGALQYTITFSLLIIMNLISFLLFNHLRRVEVNHYEIVDNISRDIASTQILLEERPELFLGDFERIGLTEQGFETDVEIVVKEWGLFHAVSVISSHKNMRSQKNFLYSDDIQLNVIKPSLYLSAPGKHLSIGDKAYLGNNTYLPPYGIRKAYINGQIYQRDLLVHGRSHKAALDLPGLRNKLKGIHRSLINSISLNDSVLTWESIDSDSIINSFSGNRLVVRCKKKTIVDNKTIIGNVLLLGRNFVIKKSSTMESCIVVADTILIEKDFKGAAQFLAERSIMVEEKASLLYPSVLYCKADTAGEGIVMQDFCEVQGEIIVSSDKKVYELFKTGIKTKVTGQIYCNGIATFHGSLLGSLYCRGFIDRTRLGAFSNYIHDAAIDFDRLPPEYGGVSLISWENGKKCIQEII